MPLKDIENLEGQAYIKKFRDYIKTLVYGTAYGLSGFGLSIKFKCDIRLAENLIKRFFRAYPKIKKFLESEGITSFYRGYSINFNGRRRYYQTSNKPMRNSFKTQEEFNEASRQYFKHKARVERQASNNSIQSVSADITKLAMAKCAKRLNPLLPDVLKYGIVLVIHDEIVLRVPENMADSAAKILKESMEEAAYQILGNTAKIEVSPSISDYWKK